MRVLIILKEQLTTMHTMLQT